MEQAMRDEPMYQRLKTMSERLQTGLRALLPLRGKSVVLLSGVTGAGKSTISNSLLIGSENLTFNEDKGIYEIREDSQISHS